MSKLVMLQGLPASGKSTYARELVRDFNYVRINKDDLRAMMFNSDWSKANEGLVLEARDQLAWLALKAGRNVVIDDTNYAPFHERTLRTIAKGNAAEFEIVDMNVDVETCVERDSKREGIARVGEKVIRDMAKRYVTNNVP